MKPPPPTDFEKRGTFDRESQAILGSTRGSSLDHNKVIHQRRSGKFHCGHHIFWTHSIAVLWHLILEVVVDAA